MTYTVSSGALNSTPTNQPISNSERSQCAPTIIIIMQRLTRHVDHKDDESQALSSPVWPTHRQTNTQTTERVDIRSNRLHLYTVFQKRETPNLWR